MSLTERVKSVSPSLTLAITAKAKKMKAEGISIVGFGAGEPDFNTPDFIIEAGKSALDTGKTKYTPSSGLPELKQAICDKFKRDNDLEYKPNQIIVSCGAKHSLYNVVMALVEKGDEVIIPSPYWLTYPELVNLAEGKSVFVETTQENSFKLTPGQLKEAITPKTKLLILNSPSNPTGAVYTKEELYALAKVIEEAGIYVISDEIYEKLVYGGVKHYSIATYSPALKEKTIVINGMSKAYAMTGWRIGYLACNETLAKAIDGMQSHATSNPCSISQYASIKALNDGDGFIKEMVQVFDDRRAFMQEKLEKINGITFASPSGAFYFLVNISNFLGKSYDGVIIKDSLDFTECALKAKIAVIPGNAFGKSDCIRLSYAISKEDIALGLDRLKEFLESIK